MRIRDFGVEMWMNAYENNCTYNLAETCVKSLTVKELLELDGDPQKCLNDIYNMQLTYGAIEGSYGLVSGLTKLYQHQSTKNIVITHGAIGANDLVINALVDRDDEVISVLPTYQQLYSIPESLGATVKILPLKAENNFLLDLEELKSMVSPKTKLICINNPNNPTGALMDEEFLKEIVEIAKSVDAWVLCDEAYRGLNHVRSGNSFTTAMVDLYDKGISVGTFSKTFSLAGLRIGWAVCNEELVEKLNRRRDYNTISCGMIDDYLASIAINHKDEIIKRNLAIVNDNADVLDEWVNNEPHISYVKPLSGTTAFLKYDMDIPSVDLCLKLLEETGVMLLPGSAMDIEGYLRIGYCVAEDTSKLKEGLAKVSEFLRQFD